MKNLRGKFERFCYRNQKKGIPNLMLWVIGLNVITYIFSMIDPSNTLYWLLCFDRNAILHGQVWRLVTFITLSLQSYSYLWVIIAVIFYIQLGKALENTWGRFRFNLYYLTGILFLDLAGFLLNVPVSADSLNTSLFLAFATLYPETTFLVFFIIPIKARWLGILNLLIFLLQLLSFSVFPFNLLPAFRLSQLLPVPWQGLPEHFPHLLASKCKPGEEKDVLRQAGKAGSLPRRRLLHCLHRPAGSPLHPQMHRLRPHRCDQPGVGIPLLLQMQGLLLLL